MLSFVSYAPCAQWKKDGTSTRISAGSEARKPQNWRKASNVMTAHNAN